MRQTILVRFWSPKGMHTSSSRVSGGLDPLEEGVLVVPRREVPPSGVPSLTREPAGGEPADVEGVACLLPCNCATTKPQIQKRTRSCVINKPCRHNHACI